MNQVARNPVKGDIAEAKSLLNELVSLVYVARELGFTLTDQYPDPDGNYELAIAPIEHDISILIGLQEHYNWRKHFPLRFFSSLDQVIDFLCGAGMLQGKFLEKANDTWSIVEKDTIDPKDLDNE